MRFTPTLSIRIESERLQNPLSMSNTNAMKQLRGPKHENRPVCGPRAAPPGDMALKVGENGHLARANGAIDGPYCSPTWPSVFERRCEPLAGRGGGFGGGAAPAPTCGAWGASSIRVPKKNARCPGLRKLLPEVCPGWLSYAPCSREGQGEQSCCFSQPTSPAKCTRRKP
jgi:hypothetical protein